MVSCGHWASICWARVRLLGMLPSPSKDWFEWLENHRLTEAFPYRLFMSIGSVIRSEGPVNDAWLRARGPPMMFPRQSPLRQ